MDALRLSKLMCTVECCVNELAYMCLDTKRSPREMFDDELIINAVITTLDRWVENGTIEDECSSLEEILMVIDWIEG